MQLVKNQKIGNKFDKKTDTQIRTFILMFKTYLKTPETYLFLIIFPILLSILSYAIISQFFVKEVRPPLIGGVIAIGCLSSIFLINTILADWKDSILIKRIRMSGLTNNGFLLAFYLVNLCFVFLALFTSIFAIWIIDLVFKLKNLTTFFEQLNVYWLNYLGFIFGYILLAITTLSLGTLIVGKIKKRIIADIILVILILYILLVSDLILDPAIMKKNLFYNILGYINPIKYIVWLIFMFSSSMIQSPENIEFITPTDGMVFLKYLWQGLLFSIIICISISGFSFLFFNINRK
ncbi:hypothetical protein [Williamsoniiplasma luminosum]|uniref:Uncharacterized protein n=1 Tax=Williamsoniiplasma luminosum TaxID=214888 RepID=A0A2S0NKQ5_9MOLU|nr:hypothetical protein [Williamsoniiplasma luminosum]AVP49587.1 MAG: hypothetical protein C5T88_03360 [Williamsoniiplasma luminosum]